MRKFFIDFGNLLHYDFGRQGQQGTDVPIWTNASGEAVPQIRLASWRVFESNLGERQLVCCKLALGSAINRSEAWSAVEAEIAAAAEE